MPPAAAAVTGFKRPAAAAAALAGPAAVRVKVEDGQQTTDLSVTAAAAWARGQCRRQWHWPWQHSCVAPGQLQGQMMMRSVQSLLLPLSQQWHLSRQCKEVAAAGAGGAGCSAGAGSSDPVSTPGGCGARCSSSTDYSDL